MRTIAITDPAAMFRDWGKRLGRLERDLGSLIVDKVYPSSQRPDPRGRAGSHIFDITLGKPLWSDGSQWIDATGTAA